MSYTGACKVSEITVGRWTRAVVLENESMRAVVLADKGASIYELVDKPRGVDVLVKMPWGLREVGTVITRASADSEIAWMDHYEGGWQEIFPNGGPESVYRRAPLPFHGVVANEPWDYEILAAGPDRAEVRFAINTMRLPFRLERTMAISAGQPGLSVRERLTNLGPEALDYMWGHHPAYGAPLLGPGCRLDVPAGRITMHPRQINPGRTWLPDGGEAAWPNVIGPDGLTRDLRLVPLPDAGVTNLGYLADLAEGWYGITNTRLGMGVGMVWPKEMFPYVWLWQEMGGSLGYPWYGQARTMGVEFWTSYPSSGLSTALANGTARRIGAGESLDVEFRCVFYNSDRGVRRILPDGRVELL